MAKKTSSRKALKSLFSRTEAGPDESPQKEQDRKRFKFPKLKIKSKNEAERQQEVRAAESRTPAQEDRTVSVKKSSSVCTTESRAKGKEFSYSELDLRKPKRFATFSFGLKKRKRRDEENISKSAFGLHSIDVQEETPGSRSDLDPADPNIQFSLSQPELDTSGTFDIPSPPHLSSNRSEAYFSSPVGSFLSPRTRPEPEELLSNGGAEGTHRAPIGSIRALQPENLPAPAAQTQTSAVPKRSEPDLQNHASSAPSRRQPDDSSGNTELTQKNTNASDAPLGQNPAPRQPDHVTSNPWTVVLTGERRTGPSRQDSAKASALGEPGSSSVSSKQAPAESSDPDSSVSAAGSDPTPPPISHDSVYGALYDSLFPPHFTSQNPARPPASQTEQPPDRTPPLLSHDPAAGSSGSAQIQVPTASRSHSRGLVLDPAASSVSGTSPETDSRVSCSKRPLVLLFTADCPPPVLWMSVPETPAGTTDGSDRALSPAYLSMGSDEGSTAEAYFSAPEDNAESGEEEMFSVEEAAEGQRSRDLLLLQGNSEFFLGSNPTVEKKAETDSAVARGEAGEELLAPPVPQVNRPMECASAPPSSDPPGEGNRARDVETEELSDGEQKAPSLQGKLLVSDTRRAEETGEELRASEGEEEERTSGSHTCSAAGGTPDAAEGAGTVTRSADGDAETLRQVSEEPSGRDARTPPPDLHPVEAPGHLDHSFQSSGAEPEPEPEDRMSSGFTSLSTKLTLRNSSPPTEEEPKPRFHKVSLVTTETSSGRTEQTDPEPEYRWKNRFQGVTQYKTSSSVLPDDDSYSRLSSASSSASSSLTDSSVYLSPAGTGGWRRSLLEEEEEPAAPAGEEEERLKGETEWRKPRWELEPLSASSCSSGDHDDSLFTGVFRATLVDLVADPAYSSTPPSSPDGDSPFSDMDNLLDTLKSMGPSQRPKGSALRAAPPALVSSLPPITEDPVPPSLISAPPRTEEPPTQPYALPAELGLKRNTSRDTRSPLELMKKSQELNPPLANGNGVPPSPTASSRLDSSLLFGSYRFSSLDQKPENGNTQRPLFRGSSLPETGSSGGRLREPGEAGPAADATGSRLERLSFLVNSSSSGSPNGDSGPSRVGRPSSLILGSPTSNSPTRLLSPTGSIDLHRPLASPEPHLFSQGPGVLQRSISLDGLSQTSLFSSIQRGPQFLQEGPQYLQRGPQFQQEGPQYLQRGPQFQQEGPQFLQRGPQFLQEGTHLQGGPQFLQEGPQFLQRGPQFLQEGTHLQGGPQFLQEGPQFLQRGPQFLQEGPQFQSQQDEPDNNLMSKYRAFPDAYLTKEKEHGKLNPRPGKMYIFDQPGMCGQRMEVRGDVIDATPWELQETISIRVIRGGWVLYEKPNFKGEKIALDEGDLELTCPFSPPEEQQQNGQEEDQEQNQEQNGETTEEQKKPTRRFIIGSIRRAVRDYSVPEISLFPEENAEGKKVVFRDTSEDARIFGFPIKANSVIVNAGLWLVFSQPFFQGAPRILEVGGYSTPAAWGVEQPYVGSLHPLKVGEPRVENTSEPKMVIYEKPYFTGKSRTITANMKDFMSRTSRQQNLFIGSLGSLKVLGGIWVGYEKEGFRGHQYLLEEGEYHDWRVWGGCDSELRSVRIIRADLMDPVMVMFEQPEEEQGVTEEKTFEVTEAIPDVELFDYKTSTRSIHVVSGAWIAYSHVDFSGNQYILEKGFYNNCADWGSQDTRVCSVQPILPAPAETSSPRDQIILYSEPDFQGESLVFHHSQGALSEKFITRSCRVVRGSWVLCENQQFSGNMYVLSEEDYPSLTSMGCPSGCSVLSVKLVPMTLSVPSISLFGLEGLEGREITTESEIISLVQDGFNNHILSVRVNSGCWVLCEHSNYRGRQFVLEPIEIPNWPKFSSLQAIGSMYPIRQKRHFFRVKNKESGHLLSVQGGAEEMKSGRVVATEEVEPLSDIWFYQEGLIKNKLSPTMCLQVMGSVEPAAKVVLWSETRQPIQTWSAKMQGLISSLTFPGMVLDIKGGRTYDKEHVVVMLENDERPSQQWEIQLL